MAISIAPKRTTRDEILYHAFEVMQQHGYQKMTLEEVANAAGLSRTAIYIHFTNKQDLALEVINDFSNHVHARLKEIARQRGGVADRVRAVLTTRVMMRLDKCQCATKSLDELMAHLRQPLLQLKAQHLRADCELLAELLIEGRMAHEFEFDEALSTAETMLLATNCLLPYSLSAKELGDRHQVEQKIDRISSMCLRAIAKSQPPSLRSGPEGETAAKKRVNRSIVN